MYHQKEWENLQLPTDKFAVRLKAWLARPDCLLPSTTATTDKTDAKTAPGDSKTSAESKSKPSDSTSAKGKGAALQPVILLLSGSFNPVHSMHIAIFDAAKAALEKNHNKIVLGAFISPSSDSYVGGKLGSEAMTLYHRNQMCRLATSSSDYIDVCDWGWASGRKSIDQCVATIKSRFGAAVSNLQGFEICGADFAIRAHKYLSRGRDECMVCMARPGSTQELLDEISRTPAGQKNKNFVLVKEEGADFSSTKIRNALASDKQSEWQALVKDGLLTQPVLDYIVANWDKLFLRSKRGKW